MKPLALLPLAVALAVPCLAADDVPDWVRQAAAQAVPSYSAKVTSVVLLQEETVTLHPDGSRVTRERGVEKVLQPGVSEKPRRRCRSGDGKRLRRNARQSAGFRQKPARHRDGLGNHRREEKRLHGGWFRISEAQSRAGFPFCCNAARVLGIARHRLQPCSC